MLLRPPTAILWDDRLPEKEKRTVATINATAGRLNEMRALEINVAGHFARSKISWKLATYQHALLHRVIATLDGVAVAWNARSTLAAILSARAFMETMSVFWCFEDRVAKAQKRKDLTRLNELAQQGMFASRDVEWLKRNPNAAATNVLTYINEFNDTCAGFRVHYDMLSERCHPNSAGHNFMFSKLDHSDGTVRFTDEREPQRNAQMVLAGIAPLPLLESVTARLDRAILEIAEFHHEKAPIGGDHTQW